jgi:tetratricopeptide (TPR) repeat protein
MQDLQRALAQFTTAHHLCTTTTPGVIIASILEDIAVIYVNQQRFDDALTVLEQARQAIPAIYDILPGVGVNLMPETEEVRIYWLRLSQIELQYSLCHFGQSDPLEGCKRLLRAFACLLTFSPQASPLRVYRNLGKRELARITDVQHLDDLRLEVYWTAQQLRIERDTVAIIEGLFEEAIEDNELL